MFCSAFMQDPMDTIVFVGRAVIIIEHLGGSMLTIKDYTIAVIAFRNGENLLKVIVKRTG